MDVPLPVSIFGTPEYSIPLPTYDDTVLVELRLSGTIGVTAQPDAPLQGYDLKPYSGSAIISV